MPSNQRSAPEAAGPHGYLVGRKNYFQLSDFDHAQNGFFRGSGWIPVVAAAYGASFLALAIVRVDVRPFLRACLLVTAIEAAVGLLGFVLHLRAGVHGPGSALDRMLYGAPPFSPLLFTDLAALGAIGLWGRLRVGVTGFSRRADHPGPT